MCNISQGIREKSWAEGYAEGKLEVMIDFVKDGLLSVVEACKFLNMSEDKFIEEMNKVATTF